MTTSSHGVDQDTLVELPSPKASTFSGSTPTERIPPIIPPTHPCRTLVLCFDGTGDQFDLDNSNIVEFFSMLSKDDRDKQMVYYQAGIGTYKKHQYVTPMSTGISKLLDEAVAWNLAAHVMDGYEFLMQNYKAGDRISIFGFSRGAYTARGLAGMIHKVGLLPACNHQQVPFAYQMYKDTDEIGWKQSTAFKKAFSIDVKIDFIGVWDTVNSVGLFPRRLPFTTSNTIVRVFRHAIALDERRAKFRANHFQRSTEDQQPSQASPESDDALRVDVPHHRAHHRRAHHRANHHNHHDHHAHHPHHHYANHAHYAHYAHYDAHTHAHARARHGSLGHAKKPGERELWDFEVKYADRTDSVTDVEEVWFSGCHCDVGGGSVANGTPNTLARIPLRWMVRECFKADTGIMFISSTLPGIGLDPSSLYPVIKPRPPPHSGAGLKIHTFPQLRLCKSLPWIRLCESIPRAARFWTWAKKGAIQEKKARQEKEESEEEAVQMHMTEEEHELLDALSPKYDMLRLKKQWWLLELVPLPERWQRSNGKWETSKLPNFGKGRFVPKQKTGLVRVHRSVRIRMDAEKQSGEKYKPKASFEEAESAGRLIWVD